MLNDKHLRLRIAAAHIRRK